MRDDLPLYLDVAAAPTRELTILGKGATPREAFDPLIQRVQSEARPEIPWHALYLNTTVLACQPQSELINLLLVDPALNAL